MLRVPALQWLKRIAGMGRRGALARTPVSPAGAVGRGGVSDLVSEFFRRQMRLGVDRIQRFAEYEVMDEDDLPSSILDLYAEDATQIDHATGRSVWLTSKNEIIAKLGEEFLRDVLRIEDNVFGLARDTAKYGVAYDCPLQEEDAKTGLKGPLIGSVPLDPKIVTPIWDEVNRLIGYRIGLEVGDSASKDKPAEPPWSLVQYMVSGRDRTGKGGTSVLQPARRPFRRLRMVEDSLCLYYTTLVSCLDGTEREVGSLVDAGPFWVYALDPETHKVVPALATAHKTRERASFVEVELDNGERVKTTPDHLWMLRDGTYQEARALKPGDSLMPLYRDLSMKRIRGYELYQDPSDSKWHFTHRLVAGKRPADLRDKHPIVHHRNGNKRDNRPDNLEWLPADVHLALHRVDPQTRAKIAVTLGAYLTTPEGKAQRSAASKARWADQVWREQMLAKMRSAAERDKANGNYAARGKKTSGSLKQKYQDDPVYRQKNLDMLERTRGQRSAAISVAIKAIYTDPVERAALSVRIQKAWEDPEKRVRLLRPRHDPDVLAHQSAKMKARWQDPDYRKHVEDGLAAAANHKVVAVRPVVEEGPAYCLDVEGYHNFALSAGVFVHNCLLRLKIAPDRLKFKIKNLAEFSPEERRSLMQEMRDEIRKKRLIDPATGEVMSEIDPFTVDDDIYVDDEMVDVDVLKGNTDLGRVLDVEYARKRFLGTVRVPPEYVGFSEARGGVLGQSPLCQIDIQFSRSCKRIQRAVITGLVRAFQIDLCWRGIDPYKPGNEFEIHMVPISFLEEKQRAETAKMRAEAVADLMEAGDRLALPKDEWTKYVLQVSGFAADLNRFNPGALALDWQGIKPAELLTAAVRLNTGRKLLEDALFPGYMSSWHLSPAGLPPVAAQRQAASVLTEGRITRVPSGNCVSIVKAAAGVIVERAKRPQSLMGAVVEGTS